MMRRKKEKEIKFDGFECILVSVLAQELEDYTEFKREQILDIRVDDGNGEICFNEVVNFGMEYRAEWNLILSNINMAEAEFEKVTSEKLESLLLPVLTNNSLLLGMITDQSRVFPLVLPPQLVEDYTLKIRGVECKKD